MDVREVSTPAPKAREVLIRVRATTVASGDHRVRAFDLPPGFRLIGRLAVGLRGPRQPILGTDASGEVAAVGAKVTRFRTGDAVVAAASATHAEYTCVREDRAIVAKPPGLGHEEAVALVFGGLTAIHYLRRLAPVRSGQRVLVHGASGAVGTAAVQLAKHLGAHVTGVCSGRNLGLVRSLGADEVLDYEKEPIVAPGRTYDVVLDAVGKLPYAEARPVLGPKGVFLPAVPSPGQLLRASLRPRGRVRAGVALGSREQLEYLLELAQKGAMRPVIDRSYALEEIVEAHRYVDTGRKRGSVVVRVG